MAEPSELQAGGRARGRARGRAQMAPHTETISMQSLRLEEPQAARGTLKPLY